MKKPVLLLLLWLFPAFCLAADVSVKTRQDSYKRGQPVTMTLENDAVFPVYSLANSLNPGAAVRNCEVKNPRGIWDAFPLKSRRSGEDEFEQAGEVGAGELVSFSWKPAVLEKGREIVPGQGLYRLTVIYYFLKGSQNVFATAKTNEFRIE